MTETLNLVLEFFFTIVLDWKLFFAYLSSVVMTLALTWPTPKRKIVVVKFCEDHKISPNKISGISNPIFYFGLLLILFLIEFVVVEGRFSITVFFGIAIFTFACMLDMWDGVVARGGEAKIFDWDETQNLDNFMIEFCYVGKTTVGDWWDPICDKMKTTFTFLLFTIRGVFEWRWFALMFVADFVGTIIRPPFRSPAKVREDKEKWLSSVSAKLPSKFKTPIMFVVFGFVIFESLGVINPEAGLSGYLFNWLCVPLAWLAVLSKLNLPWIARKLLGYIRKLLGCIIRKLLGYK